MEVVIKYSRPTPYDKAPFGQIWVAELEDKTSKYIQLSRDESVPRWSKLGDFLVDSYTQEHLQGYLNKL